MTNGPPNVPWGVETATSIPGLLFALAVEAPDKPLLGYWRDEAWRRMSRGEFALKVAAVAAGLRHQGVMPGDRVLLVSENRPEFLIADNAVMAIGAVTVPTYVTNMVSDHAHILRDSGARAAIVSTRALAARVLEAAPLDLLIGMEELPPCPGETQAVSWAELEATPADLAMLIAEVAEIPAGRLACLFYTSGTGGAPKGVMLPHRAMLTNSAGVRRLIQASRPSRISRVAAIRANCSLSMARPSAMVVFRPRVTAEMMRCAAMGEWRMIRRARAKDCASRS